MTAEKDMGFPDIEKDIYYLLNCADDGEVYVRPLWAKLDLGLVVGPGTTRQTILSTIKSHNMVISCLANHSGDKDFIEKFFYDNGAVKYFMVLGLAEEELAAVA